MEISVIPRMTIVVGDWRFDNLTISRSRIQDCMKLTGSKNINPQSLHTVGTKKKEMHQGLSFKSDLILYLSLNLVMR